MSNQYPVRLTKDPPHSADIVVIGGGIIGAATAYFAARAGLAAVVVEKRPLLATLTTPAATGAFRAQFDNAEEMGLVQEGIAFYTNFAEIAELPGYDIALQQQGYLWLATSEETAERQRELVEMQRSWGLTDVELLSGEAAKERFPYLAPDVRQARFRAGDGWLDPRKLAMGYAAASRAAFVVDTTATGFLRTGERITGILTSRGPISCGAAVIAAGPFSREVGALAGLELPLTFVRRQRMIMPDVREVPADAPMTIDEETGAHWRPALGGANLLWTAPNVPPGPPEENIPGNESFAIGLLDPESSYSVARVTPFWRTVWERNSDQWYLRTGQYSYTPDHRPFLGSTPIDGLYVNCGYSGHGIMGSAGGSRIVVDAITGKLASPANPFRLDRPIIERALDVL